MNVIISLGLFPVITRIYNKEQFGAFGLYYAVINIIALTGTCFYPSGFVIPKYKRDFYRLLKLSFTLTIFVVFLTTICIFLFKDTFVYIFKLNVLGNLIYLIPFGVLLVCFVNIFTNWNVRNKRFDKNALSNIISASSQKIVNIVSGIFIQPTILGLIFAGWVSFIFSILVLGVKKFLSSIPILRRISFRETIEIAKKYKKYPLNILPSNLINTYTIDLPIYLLTAYFSPAITGAFVLANTIMNIPLSIIGSSIASAFLQQANKLYLKDPEEMSQFAHRTNRKMLFAGVIVFGMLFGFGDLIFAIVFGEKWLIAGTFASFLSLYFIFKLVSGPMSKVFYVVGKEQYMLYISSIMAISRVIGMVLGVNSGNAVTTIIYFSIANLISYFVTFVFVFKACNLPLVKSSIETIFIIFIGFTFFYLLRFSLDQTFGFTSLINKIAF